MTGTLYGPSNILNVMLIIDPFLIVNNPPILTAQQSSHSK